MAASLTIAEGAIPEAMGACRNFWRAEMAERSCAGELRISGPDGSGGRDDRADADAGGAPAFGRGRPAPRFAFADQLIDSAGAMGATCACAVSAAWQPGA